MNAALLERPGAFRATEMPVPSAGRGELLVRTHSCGICTSDLEIWRGKLEGLDYPRFLGHEPSGVVAAVGDDVDGFTIGDHVTVWSEGKAYAEYFVTKAAYAMKLKPSTVMDLALGEPVACSTNGVLKADPQLNDTVCIVGCGFMGLIMLQVFKARGVGLTIAVDTRKSIRDLALRLGATHAFDPLAVDVPAAVKDLTHGKGVDIGVEAGGTQATLDLTGNLVRMEGKLEVFGFHVGEPRSVPWGFWNWMAFQIINGHVRSDRVYVEGMKTGIRLFEAGALDLDPLVTHRFPLSDIGRGFEIASAKGEGYVKGIITF